MFGKIIKASIFFSLIIFTLSSCIEGENFCVKCHKFNDLCVECQNDAFIPDDNGGCVGAKNCKIGKNHCDECNETNNLCKSCSGNYFPDANGGCTYTVNCTVSYKGTCLICEEGCALVGEDKNYKICKSLYLDDFKNCKQMDFSTGLCKTCNDNYYLNNGDKKCSATENCDESIYGKCISCSYGYYLDNNDFNECKSISENEQFLHCEETEDGENCSKCEKGYYLDEDNKCVNTNYCSESNNFLCTKCLPNYYLMSNRYTCVSTENCYYGDKDLGICNSCQDKYYLDFNDLQCKNNREDDDLKYCKEFKDKCISCETYYFLGEDSKCSGTKYCLKSENGICKQCSEDYYLGSDNKCTNVKGCKYSNNANSCIECEDGYYLDKKENECVEQKGNFTNCKVSNVIGSYCSECKDDYFISQKDHLCYSNEEKGIFYKCAETDFYGEACFKCIKDWYIGSKDKRCTRTNYCAKSENNICVECDSNCCLNVKNETCEFNSYIDEDYKKVHFKCKKTNEDGTACVTCLDKYILGDNGFCMDFSNCEEEKDGTCIKCREGTVSPFSYCLSKYFGCVQSSFIENCLKCDNGANFNDCTKCKEGYELVESKDRKGKNVCIPIKK